MVRAGAEPAGAQPWTRAAEAVGCWGPGAPRASPQRCGDGSGGSIAPFRTPGAGRRRRLRCLSRGCGASRCLGWVRGVACRAPHAQTPSKAFCSSAMGTMKCKGDVFSSVRADGPPTYQPAVPPPQPLSCPGCCWRSAPGVRCPQDPRGAPVPASEQGSSLSRMLRHLLPPGCSCSPRRAGTLGAAGRTSPPPDLPRRGQGLPSVLFQGFLPESFEVFRDARSCKLIDRLRYQTRKQNFLLCYFISY